MMVEELMIQLGVQPPHDVRRIDDSTRGATNYISAENLKRSGGVGGGPAAPPIDVGKTPPAEEELGMQRMRKAEKPRSPEAEKPRSRKAKKPRSPEAEKPRSQEAKKPKSQEAKKPSSQEAKKPRSQEAKKPKAKKIPKKNEKKILK